jgi:hypothetical protein
MSKVSAGVSVRTERNGKLNEGVCEQKVMLDAGRVSLLRVKSRAPIQAADFTFQLTFMFAIDPTAWDSLRSQFATLNTKRRELFSAFRFSNPCAMPIDFWRSRKSAGTNCGRNHGWGECGELGGSAQVLSKLLERHSPATRRNRGGFDRIFCCAMNEH